MIILKPLQIAIHPRASELKVHNCKGQKLQLNAHGLVYLQMNVLKNGKPTREKEKSGLQFVILYCSHNNVFW